MDGVEHRGFVIQVDDIAVWVSFMAFIKEQQRQNFPDGLCLPEWVYRGQSNSEWGLKSSFERQFGCGADENDLRLIERKSMETFRKLMSCECAGMDDAELLAYMQHYGVPTRMLDFTRSPLIALYFALPEACCKRDVGAFAVWATNLNAVNSLYDKEARMNAALKAVEGQRHVHAAEADCTRANNAMRMHQEREVFKMVLRDDETGLHIRERVPMAVYDALSPNARMKAQDGLFLSSTKLSHSFEQSFYEWKYFERGEFEAEALALSKIFCNRCVLPDYLANADAFKFEFPVSMRSEAKSYLEMANVKPSVLFPDFEGAAREVAEEMLCN